MARSGSRKSSSTSEQRRMSRVLNVHRPDAENCCRSRERRAVLNVGRFRPAWDGGAVPSQHFPCSERQLFAMKAFRTVDDRTKWNEWQTVMRRDHQERKAEAELMPMAEHHHRTQRNASSCRLPIQCDETPPRPAFNSSSGRRFRSNMVIGSRE